MNSSEALRVERLVEQNEMKAAAVIAEKQASEFGEEPKSP